MSADIDTYVTAIPGDELFADHTYQRELDLPRTRKIASQRDRRLVGIIDVADRGEHARPRYAVIDGQHRWAAATLANNTTDTVVMVCNVHTGLTVTDEAELFDRLNRQRVRITTWDHWKARRAAKDPTVEAIERTVTAAGLAIDASARTGHIRCTSTLEKLHALGGAALISSTLATIIEVWGRDVVAFDAPLVHGIGLINHHLANDIDQQRFCLALLDVLPQQVKAQALGLRQMTSGTMPRLVAIALMTHYNKRPGRKILVSARTFGGAAHPAGNAASGAAAS